MKFAYADPPYFGMGANLYGYPEWDAQQRHAALVQQLVAEYPDGWALSCNPRDLRWLLPLCPDSVRVTAWCKTYHQYRPTSVQYAWEPVLLNGGRSVPGRVPMVRDWFSCSTAQSGTLVGSKPPAFCRWVLETLGYNLEIDVLDDLFPGSGVMGRVAAQSVFTHMMEAKK